MLDRILNINPQEKYKSGLKIPSNHNYTVNRHDQERERSKDTALFSPLAKLLSRINWKILKVDYPSNDRILINFLVEDIEFRVMMDLTEICTNPYQDISLIKKVMKNRKILDYKVKLKIEKYRIDILTQADPIQTEYINEMFERIIDFNNDTNYKTLDHKILNSYISGFESKLNDELNYTLKVLYTFISTKNKNRIKKNFILKQEKNIPIIMQKVAIISTE